MDETSPQNPILRTNPILVVALFLLMVVLGDRLLAMALSEVQLSSGFRYSKLYRGQETAQVVTIGNSRGVNSFFSPALSAVTGKSVFNLSYNGMSCPLAYQLLEDYLLHNQAPELLVVEPTCVFADTRLLNALSSYFTHSPGLAALHKRRNEDRGLLAEHSALYQFNNELTLRSFYYLGRSDQGWVNDYMVSEELLDKVSKMEPEAAKTVPTDGLAGLTNMVKLAQSHGVAIKFIIGPYLPIYREKLAYWPTFIETLQAAVGTEAVIEDYSMAISDIESFADRVHLNRRGATALAERFAKQRVFDVSTRPQSKSTSP